jgi:nicotinamidase-related amidase
VNGAALLLMDFEVAICAPDGALGSRSGLSAQTAQRGVLERAGRCLEAARKHGVPVVHVRVAFDEAYTRRTNRSARFAGMEQNGLLIEGTPDTEFCAQVTPAPGETVITKGCVNPFIGTNLTERLTALGARRLFLGGVATNFVVESAARHAGDAGYEVTVLEDLCAAYSAEMHEFAITKTLPMFAEISRSEAFLATLEADAT